jgi:hypothetical protein
MRLGGWTRIGIVLTMAWVIFGFFYVEEQEREVQQGYMNRLYKTCTEDEVKRGNFDFKPCMDFTIKHATENHPKQSKWRSLGQALFPVPFVWIFVYVVVLIARWIVRGFRRPAS